MQEITVTSRQAAESADGPEEYLKQRFRDLGIEIEGIHDPRLKFERRTDNGAYRVTFTPDPRDPARDLIHTAGGSLGRSAQRSIP